MIEHSKWQKSRTHGVSMDGASVESSKSTQRLWGLLAGNVTADNVDENSTPPATWLSTPLALMLPLRCRGTM